MSNSIAKYYIISTAREAQIEKNQLLSVTSSSSSRKASTRVLLLLVSASKSQRGRFDKFSSAYDLAFLSTSPFICKAKMGVVERPLCLVPIKSPAPRMAKSASARYCPSLLLQRISSLSTDFSLCDEECR